MPRSLDEKKTAVLDENKTAVVKDFFQEAKGMKIGPHHELEAPMLYLEHEKDMTITIFEGKGPHLELKAPFPVKLFLT